MTTGLLLDRVAIARACRAHGVSRLRIFGSATTDRFDPERSDVDILVEFTPDSLHPFEDYFGLRNILAHGYTTIDDALSGVPHRSGCLS
ncbi:nucleotidyltransferase family protein [Subtercola boreus]|uniref:nucleotidyltransferase family protein n=1 Tax=Subtercola boreus TaxID=120213 RepID=UPI000E2A335D